MRVEGGVWCLSECMFVPPPAVHPRLRVSRCDASFCRVSRLQSLGAEFQMWLAFVLVVSFSVCGSRCRVGGPAPANRRPPCRSDGCPASPGAKPRRHVRGAVLELLMPVTGLCTRGLFLWVCASST